MSKKNIFIWCCDLKKTSGEGILANKFIKDLKLNNPNFSFKIYSPKNKSSNMFFERFVYPYQGIIFLWKTYLFTKSRHVCYVNYLPLWNFLLFFLLPPKTILGPITGGGLYSEKPYFNFFLRKYILNFFYFLSCLIIKLKKKKLLFSTDLLKKKFNENDNYYFNYVLKDLYIKKSNSKKKYDIIFYIRNHKNKNTKLLVCLAKELSHKFKVITVGSNIENSKILNFGLVPRSKLLNILKKTKFAFLSSENLYSLFAVDCITSNTNIFFIKNKNYKTKIIKGIYYVSNRNLNKMISFIEKQISKKFSNKIRYKVPPTNFKNYFKL